MSRSCAPALEAPHEPWRAVQRPGAPCELPIRAIILVGMRVQQHQSLDFPTIDASVRQPAATGHAERFLRIGAVLARTGLSKTTLYRLIRAGRFPRQEPLSERCTGWRESGVDRWLESPTAYRD